MSAGTLKTQCRACLEMASFLYPLEGLPANCDVSISTMISYCTLTEIDLSDDLPSGVCVQCFRTVRIAYNFIRQYKDSQKKLLEEKIAREKNQSEGESDNDEERLNVENDTAGEEEENNGDHEYRSEEEFDCEERDEDQELSDGKVEEITGNHESQVFQSGEENHFDEDHELNNVKVEYIYETVDYVEQDDHNQENEIVETEGRLDETEYRDLLVEQLESGLYEFEDNTNENNYKVRIIRQENPPNSHESTIFRMKVNTRYCCPVCPNVFFRHFERGLMRHMGVHMGETFTCSSCPEPQILYGTDTFLKHYADTHLYQCHFCQKSFLKKCSLLYHVKSHTKILYSCKQEGCGKVYPSQVALNKHETTHTNSVKHVCSECGMNFKTYDTYKYHMNRHNGKKFLCSVCGRTFILSVNLKNHMLAHKGGRPFKCSFCHKAYTSYTVLTKHMRSNHADKKRENSRYYRYDVNT